MCLNADSNCPKKYMRSVINNYIHRAHKYSQTWESFHSELLHIKQMLINNNYSNTIVDQEVSKYLDKVFSPPERKNQNAIPIYYKSQMHPNYKLDERILKDIVYSNIKCTQPNDKINLIIYYNNKKSCNLVMKNNLAPPKPLLENTNLVYAFTCPLSHSKVTSYIGFTTTRLSRRLYHHTQQGSIKEHFSKYHDTKVTKEILHSNTNIITTASDKTRLIIKEALLISKHSPIINKQFCQFDNTLKLFKNNVATEPTLPPAMYASMAPGNTNGNPPSPTASLSQPLPHPTLDLSPPSQNEHVLNTQLISPNINNRINMLLRSSRRNTSSITQPPSTSPRVLRSMTRQRHNSNVETSHSLHRS